MRALIGGGHWMVRPRGALEPSRASTRLHQFRQARRKCCPAFRVKSTSQRARIAPIQERPNYVVVAFHWADLSAEYAHANRVAGSYAWTGSPPSRFRSSDSLLPSRRVCTSVL